MTKAPRAFSLLPLGMALLFGFGCQGDGTKDSRNTGGGEGGPQASGGQASGGQASGGQASGGQAGGGGSGGSTDTCCQTVPDAGAGDIRVKETIDAPLGEAGSVDAQTADRRLKDPVDVLSADLTTVPPVDSARPDVVAVCQAGQRRCKGDGAVLQSCSAAGQWRDERTCDFACRDGACAGECMPGDPPRCRANASTPQTCGATNTWVDGPACSGDTPYCATGQCVAACVDEGQDCSTSTSACCAGSQCVAANGNTDIQAGSSKFVCKAIPACAASGTACSANTDCCAGLDCSAGQCVAKQTACLDAPAAGVCGGASGATCCPGTTCSNQYSFEPLGCMIPTTAKPQESDCPREQPAFHEACRAASFGLTCTYSDWSKANGVFFRCTCSYHGWSCSKGRYVH